MFVVFHFSFENHPGEILYVYSAKEDLSVLRNRYRNEKEKDSKGFIDQLVKEGLIVLEKVFNCPFTDLDPVDVEFYGKVQASEPFTVI